MVEDLEKVAKLLESSNLEPETIALINGTLRHMLTGYKKPAPDPPENATVFTDPALFVEWINGAQQANKGVE